MIGVGGIRQCDYWQSTGNSQKQAAAWAVMHIEVNSGLNSLYIPATGSFDLLTSLSV